MTYKINFGNGEIYNDDTKEVLTPDKIKELKEPDLNSIVYQALAKYASEKSRRVDDTTISSLISKGITASFKDMEEGNSTGLVIASLRLLERTAGKTVNNIKEFLELDDEVYTNLAKGILSAKPKEQQMSI